MTASAASLTIWTISAAATLGVIVRPLRLPEAVWAVAGAVLLGALRLMTIPAAGAAVTKAVDVCLFLTGMMLLSEVARAEGLFDWVAGHAVHASRGSTSRLFALVFGLGTVVTIFLSNDATAVVLTPAVYAAARKARADPLPMLFACALVANAASFVLPISNPANLVLYGGHMPALGPWLAAFALPAILAIGATFLMLRLVERKRLAAPCERFAAPASLGPGGRTALLGILATATALLLVSAADHALGLPTFIAGGLTALAVLVRARRSAPLAILRGISWSVLPLVAALFILVDAVASTGAIADISTLLAAHAAHARSMALVAGTTLAFASNLMNNLPAGLVASTAVATARPPQLVTDALLIGVDLGPNLSITGSLATILWLTAIRREGEDVGFWQFLKVGATVMPPAILLALGARVLLG